MPAELRDRVRYPAELFDAQAAAYERFHTESPTSSPAARTLVPPDRPVRSARGRRRRRLRRVGRGRPPAHHAAVVRLRSPARARPAAARAAPPTTHPRQRAEPGRRRSPGWVDATRPPAPGLAEPAARPRHAGSRADQPTGLRHSSGPQPARAAEPRDPRPATRRHSTRSSSGRPHLLFLPGGLMQVQSLYEGSRGPGAARLLGVTVFVNGRAGLGPGHRPAPYARPSTSRHRSTSADPAAPATVGTPVRLAFRVENARREIVTITRPGPQQRRERLDVTRGRGAVSWVPTRPAERASASTVLGLDGTRVSAATAFRVLGRPPAIRTCSTPRRAARRSPVRIPFKVRRGRHALAQVSTRAGIVFSRRYLLQDRRAS